MARSRSRANRTTGVSPLPVDISCTACGAVYEEDESVLGTEVQCGCGQVFVAEATVPAPAPQMPVASKRVVVKPIPAETPDASPAGAVKPPIELPAPMPNELQVRRPGRKAAAATNVDDAGDDLSGPWWMIGYGLLAIVIAFVSLSYFTWAEQQGGGFRSHALIVLVYSIFENMGVFLLLGGLGSLFVVFGAGKLILSALRPRSGKGPGMVSLGVLGVIACGLLFVGFMVLVPAMKSARQAAVRAQQKERDRQAGERGGSSRQQKTVRNRTAKSAPVERPREPEPRKPVPAKVGTVLSELAGGPGGGRFLHVDRKNRPMLGLTTKIGKWGGEPTLRHVRPLFEPADKPDDDALNAYAKPGYAVGGLHIRADKFVRAIRPVYFRLDDGQLDVSNSYLGEWLGNSEAGELSEFESTGEIVLGVYGHKGLMMDSAGVVFQSAD